MLPLPGSPASSWAQYRARLSHLSTRAEVRIWISFFLLGLINNVLYVIILSAALDLVGADIPKGLVLLADVVPGFLAKLIAPYFIHLVPYNARVLTFVTLAATGMLIIALTPSSVPFKLFGVALASLSSGGGELTFLGLTHFYGLSSLAAWSSGTGGAGLVGAGAYVLATSVLGLSSRTSLFAFSFLPLVMLAAFFLVLPRSRLSNLLSRDTLYQAAHEDEPEAVDQDDHEPLLVPIMKPVTQQNRGAVSTNFRENLRRARSLFFPFMLPLFLVYISEYIINQGVSPTLLYPLPSTPFRQYRDFYPTYNAIYQAGVFISRSSSPFLRVHNIYLPSILQVVNLAFLTAQSMFDFLPNIWLVFAVVFWEGLLGGLVYVNTFAKIIDSVAHQDREFSLSATTVSDSAGICMAGIFSIGFEKFLCHWQVAHGRDLCTIS